MQGFRVLFRLVKDALKATWQGVNGVSGNVDIGNI